jgi:hypothetical protein
MLMVMSLYGHLQLPQSMAKIRLIHLQMAKRSLKLMVVVMSMYRQLALSTLQTWRRRRALMQIQILPGVTFGSTDASQIQVRGLFK